LGKDFDLDDRKIENFDVHHFTDIKQKSYDFFKKNIKQPFL
jgi:hypothetical protein